MFSTLPEEDALKEESADRLWYATFNAPVESINKPDRDEMAVRYTSKVDCRQSL